MWLIEDLFFAFWELLIELGLILHLIFNCGYRFGRTLKAAGAKEISKKGRDFELYLEGQKARHSCLKSNKSIGMRFNQEESRFPEVKGRS